MFLLDMSGTHRRQQQQNHKNNFIIEKNLFGFDLDPVAKIFTTNLRVFVEV